jgi:hypothetical protein
VEVRNIMAREEAEAAQQQAKAANTDLFSYPDEAPPAATPTSAPAHLDAPTIPAALPSPPLRAPEGYWLGGDETVASAPPPPQVSACAAAGRWIGGSRGADRIEGQRHPSTCGTPRSASSEQGWVRVSPGLMAERTARVCACAQEADTALALVPEAAAERTLTLHRDTCDSSGMRSLAEILLAVDGDGRIGAAISIRVLCLQNEQNKQHAAELGVVSALVDMVSTGSPAANAAACGALQKVRASSRGDVGSEKRCCVFVASYGCGSISLVWWKGRVRGHLVPSFPEPELGLTVALTLSWGL